MALRGLFATIHSEEQKRPVYREKKAGKHREEETKEHVALGIHGAAALALPFLTAPDPGPQM